MPEDYASIKQTYIYIYIYIYIYVYMFTYIYVYLYIYIYIKEVYIEQIKLTQVSNLHIHSYSM